MSDPKETKVLELKTDPRLVIPFLLIIVGIILGAVLHKIDLATACALIGALGFPSLLGVKTIPALINGILVELQKQLAASVPPPPPPPPPPVVPELPETTPGELEVAPPKTLLGPAKGHDERDSET